LLEVFYCLDDDSGSDSSHQNQGDEDNHRTDADRARVTSHNHSIRLGYSNYSLLFFDYSDRIVPPRIL
jgi:hypothetical protein